MITIPYGQHFLDQDDIDVVVDVLSAGQLTQGPKVQDFEQGICEFVGAKYAVAVSSGTAALHLAYAASGISENDVVVTTPNTFVATTNAAQYLGAKLEFVDVEQDTLNISPTELAKICEKYEAIKAIVPVHFGGLPCDMASIAVIAKKCGAIVIEDAAHALGARFENGSRVGSCCYSDLTVFSLHPVKNIAAGEGGVVTTNSESLYRSLLRLRSHGINKADDDFWNPSEAFHAGVKNPWYYEMQELGFNYRITDMQCALASSQLKKLPSFLEKRRDLASRYDEVFSEHQYVKSGQPRDLDSNNARHLYVLKIDFDGLGIPRCDLMRQLADNGIGTQVHYIPVPMQPYYERLGYSMDEFPNAMNYYRSALSIPLFYALSYERQDFVISKILGIAE